MPDRVNLVLAHSKLLQKTEVKFHKCFDTNVHPLPNTNDQSFIIERRWTQLDKQGSIISSLRYVHVHNLLSFGDIMYIHFFFCYKVNFFN